jgi:ATP-binding protein involved in chromosome partitioning
MAQTFGVPFLGEIEVDPQIRIGGDTGKPVASLGEDAPGGPSDPRLRASKSLYAMARNVAARLSVVNLAASAPMVQIL